MTTWFVSRHPGAFDWMSEEGVAFDVHVQHLDVRRIAPGDVVIGTLPIHLAGEVNARGAAYWHLQLPVTRDLRGQELSAADLRALGTSLEAYRVEKL